MLTVFSKKHKTFEVFKKNDVLFIYAIDKRKILCHKKAQERLSKCIVQQQKKLNIIDNV